MAAAAQHALHTSVAVAQAEAAVAQQGNVQDALDALRKRMAQGRGKQQRCGWAAAAAATLVLHGMLLHFITLFLPVAMCALGTSYHRS